MVQLPVAMHSLRNRVIAVHGQMNRGNASKQKYYQRRQNDKRNHDGGHRWITCRLRWRERCPTSWLDGLFIQFPAAPIIIRSAQNIQCALDIGAGDLDLHRANLYGCRFVGRDTPFRGLDTLDPRPFELLLNSQRILLIAHDGNRYRSYIRSLFKVRHMNPVIEFYHSPSRTTTPPD